MIINKKTLYIAKNSEEYKLLINSLLLSCFSRKIQCNEINYTANVKFFTIKDKVSRCIKDILNQRPLVPSVISTKTNRLTVTC